jgi:hypothetical protein
LVNGASLAAFLDRLAAEQAALAPNTGGNAHDTLQSEAAL